MELSFSNWEDDSDVLFCKGKKVDSFQTYPREMYLSSLARAAQCPSKWWQMCPPVYRVFVWGMLSKSGDSFLTVTVWRLPPTPGKTWVFGVSHTDGGLVVCLIPWLWCQEGKRPTAPTPRPHSSEWGLTLGACISSLSSWTHVAKAVAAPWVWKFG